MRSWTTGHPQAVCSARNVDIVTENKQLRCRVQLVEINKFLDALTREIHERRWFDEQNRRSLYLPFRSPAQKFLFILVLRCLDLISQRIQRQPPSVVPRFCELFSRVTEADNEESWLHLLTGGL